MPPVGPRSAGNHPLGSGVLGYCWSQDTLYPRSMNDGIERPTHMIKMKNNINKNTSRYTTLECHDQAITEESIEEEAEVEV